MRRLPALAGLRLAGGQAPAAARPVGQAYEGTDRQCRGRLLAVLRDSREPVGQARLDAAWPTRCSAPGHWTAWWRTAWPTRCQTGASRSPARLPGTERNKLHTFRMFRHADRDETEYGDEYYAELDEDTWDPGESRAYWRRRFLILCGGVMALGVCAWLLPGTHQPSRPSAVASASMAALARQQSLPPAATSSAWQPPPPTPSPSSTPSASATAPAKFAAAAKKANGKVSPTYRPRPAASAGAACAPADIVLSLFTDQPSYAPGEQPKFSVYAVSTAAHACTLPYGPGSVQVVVTRHGQVVWNSAACKPGPARKVRFTLGVPQVLALSWNPKAAGPAGCAGSLAAGASAPSTRWRCAAARPGSRARSPPSSSPSSHRLPGPGPVPGPG